MRQYVIRLLLVLNLALAGGLLWLWFEPDGQPRSVRWIPPAPQKPDLSSMLPNVPPQGTADVGQFLATLERPLFSPTRRPPPPVIIVPPAPPPPPDPLNTIQLYGVFEGKDSGGIMARIDGKIARVRVKETVGEWTLKSIKDRDITFTKGAETRVLPLVYARPAPPAPPAPPTAGAPQPSASSAPTGVAPAGSAAANANAMNLPANPNKQQLEDYTRERLRMRNELFRRAGLPPITQ